jgi:hypothetical protein
MIASIMPKCLICGFKGFKTWREYHSHYATIHVTTIETGIATIDFGKLLEPVKAYIKLDKAVKQAIVEKQETVLRLKAWEQSQLNPLIGTDSYSSEPVWNEQREVI